LLPRVPDPGVLLPAALPVVDPLVDEPELPPAPPPPLWANASGAATASAAAKIIIAGFMVSFRGCFLNQGQGPDINDVPLLRSEFASSTGLGTASRWWRTLRAQRFHWSRGQTIQLAPDNSYQSTIAGGQGQTGHDGFSSYGSGNASTACTLSTIPSVD
jgi:hypothetical protein